jgi:hypothetical protein
MWWILLLNVVIGIVGGAAAGLLTCWVAQKCGIRWW